MEMSDFFPNLLYWRVNKNAFFYVPGDRGEGKYEKKRAEQNNHIRTFFASNTLKSLPASKKIASAIGIVFE